MHSCCSNQQTGWNLIQCKTFLHPKAKAKWKKAVFPPFAGKCFRQWTESNFCLRLLYIGWQCVMINVMLTPGTHPPGLSAFSCIAAFPVFPCEVPTQLQPILCRNVHLSRATPRHGPTAMALPHPYWAEEAAQCSQHPAWPWALWPPKVFCFVPIAVQLSFAFWKRLGCHSPSVTPPKEDKAEAIKHTSIYWLPVILCAAPGLNALMKYQIFLWGSPWEGIKHCIRTYSMFNMAVCLKQIVWKCCLSLFSI